METLTTARWRRHIAGFTFFVVLLTPAGTRGQVQSEYAVKGAFLLNFTKFVEWPVTSGATKFNICILGDDPFGSSIDQVMMGKSAFGRGIQLRRLKEVDEVKDCQIVFASSSERSRAVKLIEAVRSSSVLTIGENTEFLRLGGIICLSVEDSLVSVTINPAAAEAAKLKISSKLLGLATIYKAGPSSTKSAK